MTTAEAFAPAKINLALHITGRREDGYHMLDSLVAFAHVGDTVTVEDADDLSLVIEGPFAHELAQEDDNIVLRAARLLGQERGARITLTKRLPVASGIGGGSADAAATIRALCELWDLPWPDAKALCSLGADVPVCMGSAVSRMQGIGEKLTWLGTAPEMGILIVNPGISLPTRDVFATLESTVNPPLEEPVAMPDDMASAFEDWIGWLSRQRNDLEAPAIAMHPVIGEVLGELRDLEGCRLARMSGSGATCFAIFDGNAHCDGGSIRERHPSWWVYETEDCPFYFDQAAPRGIVFN